MSALVFLALIFFFVTAFSAFMAALFYAPAMGRGLRRGNNGRPRLLGGSQS